jgi:hypothetical protein
MMFKETNEVPEVFKRSHGVPLYYEQHTNPQEDKPRNKQHE